MEPSCIVGRVGAPAGQIRRALASSTPFATRSETLSGPAAYRWVVCAFVQPTNSPAVVSLLIDFEAGSEKKFRWKLLDREADGLRSLRKTSVADRLSLRFPIAGGEQLRLGAVIKGDPGVFDRGWVCHLLSPNKRARYPSNSRHAPGARRSRSRMSAHCNAVWLRCMVFAFR